MKIEKSMVAVFVLLSIGIFSFLLMNCSQQKNSSQQISIAVFQPATHPALDEIAQGFIDTMQKGALKDYVFDRYNANGNKVLMQAQAQEILQKNYDLVFTIATSPSVVIKDLCFKQHNKIPVVFTAVDDPEKLDLQGPNITGVVDHADYAQQLNLLVEIQPSIKKMLLVYDQSQSSGFKKDTQQIRDILQSKGIALQFVEILTIADIQQKVMAFIQNVDCVMVLKDNTVVSGIDSLIKLCDQYEVTLLASDLNSGEKGAALAYGIYEAESGIQAAHQAKLILEEGKLPSQVPVASVKNMKMKINCKHALLQGLHINCATFSMSGVELDQKGDDHV
ncbi:ABC transporter substrate-binding protein [Candidatus Babeliales bacterium]|nr:ABC transporter substrate-binding protein [Candidatus Babeliales bacterium]MBP9844326.1 ABC transporter substrate-binding protein [Candidatus Babeliales bacterium]